MNHYSTATATRPSAAPPWTLLGLEPVRAALEYADMRTMNRSDLPKGDGHPVVFFPGLASDRRALAPLRDLCGKLGYAAHDWGRGFNTGPKGDPDEWLDHLANDVQALVGVASDGISLVGWSLGGIYARELAKRLQPRVRQVITIGTPFAGSGHDTHAGLVYRLLNGRTAAADEALLRRLRTAPAVPTTSIYSRSDGVVAWQACIQAGTRRTAENIEVFGSHCGLGWNSEVFRVVADRLSQPVGNWRRYRARASAGRRRVS